MPLEDDDKNWADALAGKPAPDARQETRAEAQALRRAILDAKPHDPAADFDVEGGLQRVLFKLRQQDPARTRPRAAVRYGWFALAAAVLLGLGVVTMMPGGVDRPPAEDLQYRGMERAQVLFAQDVPSAVAGLKADLESLGLTPNITPGEDATRVETQWPAQADERHRAVLERHYLRQPDSGSLRVDVRRRP